MHYIYHNTIGMQIPIQMSLKVFEKRIDAMVRQMTAQMDVTSYRHMQSITAKCDTLRSVVIRKDLDVTTSLKVSNVELINNV